VPLFGSLLVASFAVSLLASSIFLLPIAVWLAGLWALVAPTIELEDVSAVGALRRSGRLVRGRWLKVASLIVGVVYAVAMPFVALTTAYVYFHARTRVELEAESELSELRAEIELAT
jgi:hypothetical protein